MNIASGHLVHDSHKHFWHLCSGSVSLMQVMISCQVLGDRKFEFNFYNCKEKKKVLCEVPTDMEKITKRKKKKNKKKTG